MEVETERQTIVAVTRKPTAEFASATVKRKTRAGMGATKTQTTKMEESSEQSCAMRLSREQS